MKTTWDSKTTECILIGFSDTENLFELWDIGRGASLKRRDVIFFEDKLGSDIFRNTALKRGLQIFPASIPASYTENHIRDNPRPVPPITKPVLPLPRRPPQQTMNRLPSTRPPSPPLNIVFQDLVVQQVSATNKYPEVSFTTPLGIDTPELILSTTKQHQHDTELREVDMFTMMMAAVDSLSPIAIHHTHTYLPHTYHQAISAQTATNGLLLCTIN